MTFKKINDNIKSSLLGINLIKEKEEVMALKTLGKRCRVALTGENVLLRETFKIEYVDYSTFSELAVFLEANPTMDDLLGNSGIPLLSYVDKGIAYTGSRKSAKIFSENGMTVTRGVYDLQL
ncbi:MAG: hypothetical protein PHZ26_02915 [Candidatus Gracilibacteria bacterium]|nr:hypothetical protein [Candidatus Gracilibacteria bacterium]MDD2908680.1 hypothetical protein [Candidatus Gracilibacteria bacterium]